jgi:hypothetical protein
VSQAGVSHQIAGRLLKVRTRPRRLAGSKRQQQVVCSGYDQVRQGLARDTRHRLDREIPAIRAVAGAVLGAEEVEPTVVGTERRQGMEGFLVLEAARAGVVGQQAAQA